MKCMGYFTCVKSSVTAILCNKWPKWLIEQNSSYSDYFNVIFGFTSNSRAPGGPVTTPPRQTTPWANTPLGRHPPRHTSPLGKSSLGRTPPPRDGHCSGRYASYWNAFLLNVRLGFLAHSILPLLFLETHFSGTRNLKSSNLNYIFAYIFLPTLIENFTFPTFVPKKRRKPIG